jgi:Spy/CpxP family protein refolding chaperone
MHPAMFERLRHARRFWQGCGPSADAHGAHHHGAPVPRPPWGGCGAAMHGHGDTSEREGFFAGGRGEGDGDGDFGGGGFGVRRPLRFLAHKLDLDDRQVGELAAILSDLKTERAQAAVDHRRSTAAFADSMAVEAFDDAKVSQIASERVRTAERLRDAVVRALGRIHALLTADQRGKLAYLIRTGVLSL